jgi:hypothetical protein
MRNYLAWAVLIGLSLSFATRAQTPAASVTGRVTDASKSAVAQATVRIRSITTGEARQADSGIGGEFTITNLAPDKYELFVEKSGFRNLHQTGIELQVDQTARFELQLEVGAIQQTVEVTANVPLLNTENATKGDVVITQEISEMPLNGRSFSDLAYMVPSVEPSAQGGDGSGFNIGGARADQTNFVIDGFQSRNSRGGGTQAAANLDAIQEFKMQTTGYPAEQGRLAGGVLNTVLKTGGNTPHGTLFEFLRNDYVDARNFFSLSNPPLRRNQFGAMLSGPVWVPKVYRGRDRTFFLVSWESFRQTQGQTRLTSVPTELQRTGDFSQTKDAKGATVLLLDPLATGSCTATVKTACFPGNLLPASRIDPAAQKLFAYYPHPTFPGQGNNLLASGSVRNPWDGFVFKVDHRASDKDSLSFRYMPRSTDSSDPFAGGSSSGFELGIFGEKRAQNTPFLGMSYTRVFTPTFLNEFRMGFSRFTSLAVGKFAGQDIPGQVGIPGITSNPSETGFPVVKITGYASMGDPTKDPESLVENDYQYSDTATWVKSKHLVKFGGQALRTQMFQSVNNALRGNFNFLGRWTNAAFADALLGYLDSVSRRLGSTHTYLFDTNVGAFVQDDWRARPDLTVNLGLRYELTGPLSEKYGHWGAFSPALGKFILSDDRYVPNLAGLTAAAGLGGLVGVARDFGMPESLMKTNYTNFAPRVGLAWRPRGQLRTVVRGGYGIFYGSSMTNRIRNNLGNVFPFGITQQFSKDTKNPRAVTLSNPFPATGGALTGVSAVGGIDAQAASPYSQNWNLTIEREIGGATAIEVSYEGSKGTHLDRSYDVNQPVRVTGGSLGRPWPTFAGISYFRFGSNSSYNAGMVTLKRRFRNGLFYRVGYTYGKSIDDASQNGAGSNGGYIGAQDARNLRLERGRSDWDTRHSLKMTVSAESPFRRNRLTRAWQIALTGRMSSGQPFTPVVANSSIDRGEADRPDRIATGSLPNPTPALWFDTKAFVPVPTGSYRVGTSGRNILDGPGYAQTNVALSRLFRLNERHSFQLRWELFNATNHTSFLLPNTSVDVPAGGGITSAYDARIVQFGLRYLF